MDTGYNRNYSIDALRIMAAIAVMTIHIVSAPVKNYVGLLDPVTKTNLQVIHTLMNWSVPVFFMITGYCLSKKAECTYEYCFSHVLKYIAALFTVGLLYALMEEVYTVRTVNAGVFVRSVQNVIAGRLWDHMWFVYAIIGIYLVMPVIHGFMKQRKNALILTVLLFCFTILFPSFADYLPIGIEFPFGGYLFYVCSGSLVAALKICGKSLYFCAFSLISAIYIYIWWESGIWLQTPAHMSAFRKCLCPCQSMGDKAQSTFTGYL